MNLIWPWLLTLLFVIPVLAAIYIWNLRRRRRFTVRYSSLALVRAALPHQSQIRRHLPFGMFMLALSSLIFALARPVSIINVPTGQATVILAMDVSRSMCSTDIHPNRLEAAKAAAKSFIDRREPGLQIGIVAFAGFAELIQQPTSDGELLQDALGRLRPGSRTGIGSAILRSLETLTDEGSLSLDSSRPGERNTSFNGDEYSPDIIVLLTDGASNTGPLPLEAAFQAVERGIRVYTIGFGTEMGGLMNCGDRFGGGGLGNQQFGGSFRRGIDEPTLIAVADMTGGEYYSASSAGELLDVFRNLPTNITTRQETSEISVAFTIAGALLSAGAVLLSLVWNPLD
jgi:Ca-activated chloride channel homolog